MSKIFEWLVCLSAGHRITDYLEAQVTLWHSFSGISRPSAAISRTLSEIALATRLSEWRVHACLRRLSGQGKVEQDNPDHWRVVLYP